VKLLILLFLIKKIVMRQVMIVSYVKIMEMIFNLVIFIII